METWIQLASRMVSLSVVLVVAFTLFACEEAKAQTSGDRVWTEFSDLGMLGNGWVSGASNPYSRLPDRAADVLSTGLIELGKHSAGLHAVFATNADTVFFRWKVSNEILSMPHMPATGVSGLDVYVRANNEWRWVKTGFPTEQRNEFSLRTSTAKSDTFLVYLPLYNGIDSVAVGVSSGFTVEAVRDVLQTPPIVFYGTSITHGCCASRPGMAYPAILERRLMRQTVNLGFSGSCKMERDMALLLAEIEAEVYFIDCLPNMGAELVEERAPEFLGLLRELRPDTPIILAEDRTYADAFFDEGRAHANATRRESLRRVYDLLVARGFGGLTYVTGDEQLGSDGEGTVDGSHPNDLGFFRQANYFEEIIRRVLGN